MRKEKKGRKLTKLLSRKSVQGWVENLSNYVAQHNWTDFRRKKMVILSFFFCFLSHSPCRKKILEKQNEKKEENLDRCSTQKRAVLGQIFDTTATSWSKFGVFKAINWSKFVFFKTLLVKKHYKNRGFRTFF